MADTLPHDFTPGDACLQNKIILVTGAGGVFKQVLTDSQIGESLARSLVDVGMTPVSLAFCVAAVVRVSQGSATVAMMTAAGLVGGVLELARKAPAGDPMAAFAQADLALITIAIAASNICGWTI